jgi:hypothetical protein
LSHGNRDPRSDNRESRQEEENHGQTERQKESGVLAAHGTGKEETQPQAQ